MALSLPVLGTIYNFDATSKYTLYFYNKDSSTLYWQNNNSARIGANKMALGYRTKGFIKGKTYVCRPWDVRINQGDVQTSSGYCPWGTYKRYFWDNKCVSSTLCFSWPTYLTYGATLNEPEINEAITCLVAKARTADIDYGVMFAEMGETLRMIRNPLQGLRKILKKSFGRKHLPKETANAVSEQWLELRYGITPLINDIQSLIEGMDSRIEGKVYRKSTRYLLAETKQKTDIGFTLATAIPNTLAFAGYKETISTRKIYGKLYFRPTVSYRNDGLSVYDIPSTVWELIPFSFVLDWFAHLGKWITAMTPDPRITFLQNCITLDDESVVNYYATKVQPAGDYPWNYSPLNSGDKYSVTAKRVYRLVNVSLPAYPPLVTVPLGLKQEADGLSLIWQKTAKYLR